LSESLHSEAQGISLRNKRTRNLAAKESFYSSGIGSIGGISSGERSIFGISQLPGIDQVELLVYEYQN